MPDNTILLGSKNPQKSLIVEYPVSVVSVHCINASAPEQKDYVQVL